MSLGKTLMSAEIVLLAVMLLGVVGHRFQILPFKLAFGGFALSLLLAAVLALLALIIAMLTLGPLAVEHRGPSIVAAAVGLLPLLTVVLVAGPGFKAPRIHDISTDTENNLTFTHAHTLRHESENSLDLPSNEVIQQQQAHYDLDRLQVDNTSQAAYEKALSVAEDLGWKITYRDPERMTFEALEKTALFGFIDDVVIRVSETTDGAFVDIRSVSRVGVSDLGANAKRIKRFQKAYRDKD